MFQYDSRFGDILNKQKEYVEPNFCESGTIGFLIITSLICISF